MIKNFSKTYSSIRNSSTDSGSKKTNIIQTKVFDTQRDYGLYENDKNTQLNFPEFVGTTSPIWESLSEKTDSDDGGGQEFHVYKTINKYKVCDIAVIPAGNQSPPAITSTVWGNWRTNNYASIKVSNNVFLWPSEKTFNFNYTNEYGSAWEKLSSSGLLSKVSQAAELARSVAVLAGSDVSEVGGKFVSKYTKAPNWKETSPISLSNTIKFEFSFGQAGIFSAEQEVVKPILALASMFAPIPRGQDGYLVGPMPTPPAYLANYFKQFVGGAGGLISDVGKSISASFEGDDNIIRETANSVISTLTAVESGLLKIQENAIVNTLNGSLDEDNAIASRAICIRYGRMAVGPMTVKDVAWSFDFTHVDEYGFPYKGTLQFSGLENITTTQTWDIAKPFCAI